MQQIETSNDSPASTDATLIEVRGLIQDDVLSRLAKVEGQLAAVLELLVRQRTIKDFYSTEEVAGIVGASSYTVREWCRHGRIRAEKRESGRGDSKGWKISHAELTRYQNEGLLPLTAAERRCPA